MRPALWLTAAASFCCAADLRVGIVGTDTTHAVAFTKILNDAASPNHVAGARVTGAWMGGSADVESSVTRREKFAAELRDTWGIRFYPDIASLCREVDAVLLESVDGRVHLEQARAIFAAGKPVFIDKPLADSLAAAREIARLGRESGVAWFSSSSSRFSALAAQPAGAGDKAVQVWGPGPMEPHQQLDLSWYAIHPIELLFTLMGPGCEQVWRTSGADAEVVTCRWRDGRLGTVTAVRPSGEMGGAVIGRDGKVRMLAPGHDSYRALVERIVAFFQTGRPPVANELTLEIFEFMDAAQRSRDLHGAAVKTGH